MAKLYVRDFKTRSVVSEIDVTGCNENKVERIMLALLHQMNTDDYFVDDDECKFDDDGHPIESPAGALPQKG